MAKFDVFDEAIINAKPDIVYKALLSGAALQRVNAKTELLEGSAAEQLGALTEITLPSGFPIKFTVKTVEVKKNELWRTQYVEGAFRGEGVWKFEAVDGNTKISFHWCASPSTLLLRILALLVNIPKQHSALMKKLFASLNEYVKEQEHS